MRSRTVLPACSQGAEGRGDRGEVGPPPVRRGAGQRKGAGEYHCPFPVGGFPLEGVYPFLKQLRALRSNYINNLIKNRNMTIIVINYSIANL